jgi:hypothetical protein
MKNLHRIGLLAAALAASPAFAQIAPHWYAGVGAGIGNLNASGSDLTNLSNASIDDSDKTYTVRLGYRFHPNFALEAGYYDFGKYTFSGNTAGPGATDVSGSFKAKSYGLSFVALAPLSEQFDIYGRVGYARSELKPNANTSNFTASREDKQKRAHLRPRRPLDVRQVLRRVRRVGEERQDRDRQLHGRRGFPLLVSAAPVPLAHGQYVGQGGPPRGTG